MIASANSGWHIIRVPRDMEILRHMLPFVRDFNLRYVEDSFSAPPPHDLFCDLPEHKTLCELCVQLCEACAIEGPPMKFPREADHTEPYFLNPKTCEPNWLVEFKARQRASPGSPTEASPARSRPETPHARDEARDEPAPASRPGSQPGSRPVSRPVTAGSRGSRPLHAEVVFADVLSSGFDNGIGETPKVLRLDEIL